jgi:hypothetical protein
MSLDGMLDGEFYLLNLASQGQTRSAVGRQAHSYIFSSGLPAFRCAEIHERQTCRRWSGARCLLVGRGSTHRCKIKRKRTLSQVHDPLEAFLGCTLLYSSRNTVSCLSQPGEKGQFALLWNHLITYRLEMLREWANKLLKPHFYDM